MASDLNFEARGVFKHPGWIKSWTPGEAAFEFILMTALVDYLDYSKAPAYSDYVFKRFRESIDDYWPGRFNIEPEWVDASIFLMDFPKTEQIAVLESLRTLLIAMQDQTVPPGADYWKKKPEHYIEATKLLISRFEAHLARWDSMPPAVKR